MTYCIIVLTIQQNVVILKMYYDGSVYKKHFQPRSILGNISLTMNTDGIQVFNSSNFAIRPIYFIINELPYKLRTKFQNCILGGLWFKPNMHLFLKPLWKSLSSLETTVFTGVSIMANTMHGTMNIITKAILLFGAFDLSAKAATLNFKQYNGFNGCSKCLQSGKTQTWRTIIHTHLPLYP